MQGLHAADGANHFNDKCSVQKNWTAAPNMTTPPPLSESKYFRIGEVDGLERKGIPLAALSPTP